MRLADVTCSCAACQSTNAPDTWDEMGAGWPGDKTTGGQGDPGYLRLLDELRALHMEKSEFYGTTRDPLENFQTVAKASGQFPWLYPYLRIVEKCQRITGLVAGGRVSQVGEELLDIASLALCAVALRRRQS